MSISCTTTVEGDFQVLDSVPIVPPGTVTDETAGGFSEEGLTQIVSQSQPVLFTQEKANDQYEFEVLEVQNTVDASPFILVPEITAYSTTGFTVQFNGEVDTGNYFLRWKVVL